MEVKVESPRTPFAVKTARSPSVEKMPGHMLLARLGKRVLRPGGRELTGRLLDHLSIGAQDDVVELAPGKGATSRLVIEFVPNSYVGVEADADWAYELNAKLGSGIPFEAGVRHGNARDTGLAPGSASVVFGEAMLTMLSDDHKCAVLGEAARVLRQGGRYGIHELCLRPDDLDEVTKSEIRLELTRSIHVGARPLTVAEWSELVESAGLRVVAVDTAPMHLLEPGRVLADEGLAGAARILANVLRDRPARQRVVAMRRTFRRFEGQLAAVAIVAEKPLETQP